MMRLDDKFYIDTTLQVQPNDKFHAYFSSRIPVLHFTFHPSVRFYLQTN